MAKQRTPVPKEIAARVLFEHDRTCCVCRHRGKPVQIHHLNEDPSSHSLDNLAVLCFDCHRETQIRGGFDRKLDADQVRLFREDWLRLVRRQRSADEATRGQRGEYEGRQIELATSAAEILRERKQFELLAVHYSVIGNAELRDKYVETALQQDPSDQSVAFLRHVQGSPNLIPDEVVEREIERYTRNEDWSQRARFFRDQGRHEEAVADYLRTIQRDIEDKNSFSAAFYLKELQESGLLEEMFVIALRESQEESDLWWQIRALEELGWDTELKELVLANESDIVDSEDLFLLEQLARAKGDIDRLVQLRKEITMGMRVAVIGSSPDDEEQVVEYPLGGESQS
jgi:hypothetical protein